MREREREGNYYIFCSQAQTTAGSLLARAQVKLSVYYTIRRYRRIVARLTFPFPEECYYFRFRSGQRRRRPHRTQADEYQETDSTGAGATLLLLLRIVLSSKFFLKKFFKTKKLKNIKFKKLLTKKNAVDAITSLKSIAK